jgi:hypothetical protein
MVCDCQQIRGRALTDGRGRRAVTVCARIGYLLKYTTYESHRRRRRAVRTATYAVLFGLSLVVMPIAFSFYADAVGVSNGWVEVLGGVVITAALSAALWWSQ